MRKFGSFIFILLFTTNAFGADYSTQKVEIAPLTGGVSFNTVTTLYKSWVTAPTVEMIGRKELMILNKSITANLYLTGVSGGTATWILYPRESMDFKVSSSLHIYASGDTVQFQTAEIR